MPSPGGAGAPIRAATQKPLSHGVQLAELIGTVRVGVFELGLEASGSGAKVDMAWSHSFLPEGKARGRSQRSGQQEPGRGSRVSSAIAASQPSRSSQPGGCHVRSHSQTLLSHTFARASPGWTSLEPARTETGTGPWKQMSSVGENHAAQPSRPC